MAEEMRVHSIIAGITADQDKFGTEFVNRSDKPLHIRKVFISMTDVSLLIAESISIEVGESPIYSALSSNDGQTFRKVHAHLTANGPIASVASAAGTVEKYLFARGEWPLEESNTLYAHANVSGSPSATINVDIWYHFSG